MSGTAFGRSVKTTSPVHGETPGGLINGSNTAFTTAVNYVSGSLKVYRNGVRLKGNGDDYTETTGGFTMVTAPETGARLLVDYFEASSTSFDETSSVITGEVPTGTINGVTTLFTVQSNKYVAGSLQVWVNGLLQAPSTHYTETDPTAGTFTFSDAPETGDNVLVAYMVANFGTGNADMLDGQHASAFVDTTSVQTLTNKTLAPGTWHEVGEAGEPAYQNGWVKYDDDGTYDGAWFMKDAAGNVHIRGLVKNGTASTTIFTLPVGYRPLKRLILGCASNNAFGRLDIDSNGNVNPGSGTSTWVSLAGITFPAEQ